MVQWIDSHLEVYQVPAGDLPTPALIWSVGYIAAETADYLTLAREQIGKEWRGVVSIPKECIRERSVLCARESDDALQDQ